MVTLSGYTFASAAGADVTIVAAAANVAGVKISLLDVSNGGSGSCGLKIGANQAVLCVGGSAGLQKTTLTDIYIPSGVDVILTSSIASAKSSCYYKTL